MTSLGGSMNTGAPWQINLGDAPDVYTVKVMPLDLPSVYSDSAPNIIVSAYADIVFGAQGQVAKRRVSVGQGVSISGQCDYINLTVTDNTPVAQNTELPVNPICYMVSAVVAPGVRPDSYTPPTLGLVDDNGYAVTPAEMTVRGLEQSAVFTIPQNVGVISIAAGAYDSTHPNSAIPTGEILLYQLGPGGLILAATDPRVTPWIPLVPGAQAIQFSNGLDADDVQFYAMFGVDG
jgi:hypothetical protein